MRILAAALGALLGVYILVLAPPPPERAVALATYRTGDSVVLPRLVDLDGEQATLARLSPPAAGATHTGPLVIAFWSARCPIARGYGERLERLAADYAPRGVSVIRIAANTDETSAEIRAASERDAVPVDSVPILVDPAGRLAEQLGIEKTPHFVILAANGELAYSGAFDSNLKGSADDRRAYVRDALDALLTGAPVTVSETRVFGCPVRSPSAATAEL